MTVKQKYDSWLACPAMPDELLHALREMSAEDVSDSFYRDLSFGTGGLRGVLGAGTNRMNVFTVMKATAGLGQYLKAHFNQPSCAVSCDSRIHSRDFAELTSAVLADMGITVWLYPRLQPTPMLSFAVRHLSASAGVMITASHNPAKYNGYKVYGSDGCQITLEAANEIQKEIMLQPDLCDTIPSFGEMLSSGRVRYIPDTTVEAYYQAVLGLRKSSASSPLKVVYSPLNGAGNVPVREVISRMGNVDMTVVTEQENPDGSFPTCPYPNPEVPQAMSLAMQKAVDTAADLCFATDPDSDRMGAGVRVGGRVELISGNDMGILMLDYLCRNLAANRTGTSPVVVKTIVTTEMASALCQKYGVELRNVLTGFKFIGEQIGKLESAGQKERFLFGFEESYGYLSGTDVRDKDAVNAAVLLCDMASELKASGKTLLDRLNELRTEYGFYAQRLLSYEYSGEKGASVMAGIMSSFRIPAQELLPCFLRKAVRTDYLYDDTGLPKSDVIEFRLSDGDKVVIRPSGTEPKLKIYLFSRDSGREQAEKKLDVFQAEMEKVCRQ